MAGKPEESRPWRVAAMQGLVAFVVVGATLLALGQNGLWALPAALALGAWRGLGTSDRTAPAAALSPPAVDLPARPGLEALIDQFGVPLVVTDADLIVTRASSGAKALFPALSEGRPLALAIRDPDLLAAMTGAEADGETETVFVEAGAVDRTWRARIRRLDGRRDEAFAILLEDLTEQRATERLRVDFIANASHELRTPLASLLGFVETLQGPARDDAAARGRFLGIMREQASRMARLIDDLLSLSRAEQRAHQRPAGAVDLAAVAAEIRDSLSVSARERGVAIELAKPTAPVMVRGDRDDMLRLVENLIENAIKYGASGQRVEVTVTGDPGPRIEVRDYGPGIAPAHIPRLTERFYRADASHSREIGGTGLGLAIVKHIVARHGARLEVQSRLGEGSSFCVSFPRPEPLHAA